MRTRYKVSAETLGLLAGVHEGRPDDSAPEVTLAVTGVGFVTFPRSALEVVRLPDPAEPPMGSVVRAQLPDEDRPWVFERSDDHTNGPGWYAAGVAVRHEWAELCEHSDPELLWTVEGSLR